MKYSIEGEIDFYAELNSLSNDVNIDKDAGDSDANNTCNAINENNICLITGDKLTDHSVELKCGHKFNYIPLYNDIKNHKLKFNHFLFVLGTIKIVITIRIYAIIYGRQMCGYVTWVC